MDVVVSNRSTPDSPKLTATGAATARVGGFNIVGVVVFDLVVVHHDVGDAITILIGIETVLTIVGNTVVRGLLTSTHHHGGTVVKLNGVMVDRPVVAGVVVDNTFIVWRYKMLDSQVLNFDIGGIASKGVVVFALTVKHGAGRTNEGAVIARCDLREFVTTQSVGTRCKPICGVVLAKINARIVAGWNTSYTRRSGYWSATKNAGIATDL